MIERTEGTEARAKVAVDDLQSLVRSELELVQEELARFFVSDITLINQISRHMMRANGKRFRPTLLLLFSRLHGPVTPEAILAGAIVELVHTATLIHDDSIDRSFTRRGLPTVNSLWNDQTSVIMGDYLYTKAFYVLLENGMDTELRILTNATHRMSLGEMLELEKKLDFAVTEEAYSRLILEKTAVLISAACELGALVAWGDGRERRLAADFGTNLGMAFQIMDDILDIEGDAATMGKSTESDIRDGKITLPLIHALREAPAHVVERIQTRMLSGDFENGGAAEIASFAAEYGGLEYARHRARGYADRAIELLDDFEDNPVRATLHDAVEYVLDRRQ